MKPNLVTLVSDVSRDCSNVAAQARIDAIIVPTVRSASSLAFAAELAKEAKAYLLVFCSGNSSAAEVNALLPAIGAKGTALAVPQRYTHALLAGFATDAFAQATYGRAHNDLSLKRNLGLIFGRLAGWKNLFFLDDDIRSIHSRELEQAVLMLAAYPAVGFKVTAFPDNSAVRHAQRLSGVEPGVRVSGGALAAAVTKSSMGFFPNIYNEDWFFLYDSQPISAVATARQLPYDPFGDPLRAASEEFGDTLAEGIVDMQAAGLDCSNASEADWRDILAKRQKLLDDLQSCLKISGAAEPARQRALAALAAAKARHTYITPTIYRNYIKAWRHDVALWQARLSQQPVILSVAEITSALKLSNNG